VHFSRVEIDFEVLEPNDSVRANLRHLTDLIRRSV
jgi:hypothetical protein